MNPDSIIQVSQLTMPWATQDPFIFCAYHRDLYPGGNDNLGPDESLKGRNIGQDFGGKDGWSMYHGKEVPGFPAHPHRGFETVTVVTEGLVDHSDSLGSTGRFGNGDVQWLTSGKGVQHAEMFPLVSSESNHFELFQIWLNLPRKDKMVDPYYRMLWHEDIPLITETDTNGKKSVVKLVAGKLAGKTALLPTQNSWAMDSANEVQIWTLKMEPNAGFTLPKAMGKVNRSLYFYAGNEMEVDGKLIKGKSRIMLKSNVDISLKNGSETGYFLFLQGKPIGEPVVQYGPFVMNSNEEIQEAFDAYQVDQFGGWPWSSLSPTNEKEQGRFALHSDGTREEKG